MRGFDGPIVDVGSGGGTPGIPLAASLPDREVTLLEAERRKTEFLQRWTEELPNLERGLGPRREPGNRRYGVAVAKALAQPPVAAEWCLPLVEEGGAVDPLGRAVARTRMPSARAAERLAGELEESPPGFFVLRKTGPTPPGFPRRPGWRRSARSPSAKNSCDWRRWAFRSRMPLNSSVEATTSSQSGQRFGRTRNSISARS